jgi:hypothetical protein
MRTEEWEETFRDKVDGLDSPPPQTKWNSSRSWGKLEKQLARQAEPVRRKIVWWRYAAAAIVLLVPTLVLNEYVNRQKKEIGQLKGELAKVKSPVAAPVQHHDISREIAGIKAEDRVLGPADRTREVKPSKRKRPVNREKALAPASLPQPAERSPAEPVIGWEQTANVQPISLDTATNKLAVAPTSAPVVTIIRKTSKAPVARTVVFVFQGDNKSQDTQLADASLKPARKFIFLSAEKELTPSTKPEEAQNPFSFTAKPKANP